jgi:protein-disulfide isomerase
MAKKNKSEFVKNDTINFSIKKDTLNALLVPVSILLAGLFVTVAVLYSANRILDSDQLVTKSNLASAVTDALKNANVGTVAGEDTGNDEPTGPVLAKTTIDNDAKKGNAEAKVAIVEFSDYECPFCQRHYNQTESEILKNYVDNGKALYVFRDNPLSFHEPKASQAANGMECAKELGGDAKYFELHNLYFKNTVSNGEGLKGGNEEFANYAAQIGLDKAKFVECLNSNKFTAEIQADMDAAAAAGASGTPGFIIGKLDANGNVDGELISGAYPYATFQATIDKYLNS